MATAMLKLDGGTRRIALALRAVLLGTVVASLSVRSGSAQPSRRSYRVAEIVSGLAAGMSAGRWRSLLSQGGCVVGGERLQAADEVRLRQVGATDELLASIRTSPCVARGGAATRRSVESDVSDAISRTDFALGGRAARAAMRSAPLDRYAYMLDQLKRVQDACLAYRRAAGSTDLRCPRDP
jgi:hypothetical protein